MKIKFVYQWAFFTLALIQSATAQAPDDLMGLPLYATHLRLSLTVKNEALLKELVNSENKFLSQGQLVTVAEGAEPGEELAASGYCGVISGVEQAPASWPTEGAMMVEAF